MREITAEELGRRIRAARQAVGFSQEQLASELGISQPTISRIEQGQDLTSTLLNRIAILTGRDLGYFLAPEPEDLQVSLRSSDGTGTKEVAEAVEIANRLIQDYEFLVRLTNAKS